MTIKIKSDKGQIIGTEVTNCIKDIILGRVAIGDVAKIFTLFNFRNEQEMEAELATWRKNRAWGKFPDKAEAIFHQLAAEGKIENPRLLHPDHYPKFGDLHWVESEDEIVWDDQCGDD